MAEQQLIDYIQKARQANQGDEQSRALLIKNGWTDAEVNDAILALPKTQSQPEPAEIKPQVQSQPQITSQPETKIPCPVPTYNFP